jgi:hypothetical protein
MQARQQPVMAKPPAVITAKDLDYLKDGMSWLLLATKKCAHFANECQDQEVKQLLNQIGQTHQGNYNTLLAHCQTQNNNTAMSQVGLGTNQQANQQWQQQQQ